MKNKAKILIVEDAASIRKVLHNMMILLGHKPFLAKDGIFAMTTMKKQFPDIVLLDILMPKMDGYEVLKTMKEDKELCNIPVIVLTAVSGEDSAVKCLKMGADDYLVKPFRRQFLEARIGGCLERKKLNDEIKELNEKLENKIYVLNNELKEKYNELEELYQKLEDDNWVQSLEISRSQQAIIFALAKVTEARHKETGKHLERVAEYCRILCKILQHHPRYKSKIVENFDKNLCSASPLHDIGKAVIPDNILKKPGKLNKSEIKKMKTHTKEGADILNSVIEEHGRIDLLLIGKEVALYHHEKWDGSGYPDGKKGDNIPLSARILTLADAYDAITSKRCYDEEEVPHEECVSILEKDKGSHFDPVIFEALKKSESEFNKIRKRYKDTKKQ